MPTAVPAATASTNLRVLWHYCSPRFRSPPNSGGVSSKVRGWSESGWNPPKNPRARRKKGPKVLGGVSNPRVTAPLSCYALPGTYLRPAPAARFGGGGERFGGAAAGQILQDPRPRNRWVAFTLFGSFFPVFLGRGSKLASDSLQQL
eukprot:2685839-Rhodomonas_salina.1